MMNSSFYFQTSIVKQLQLRSLWNFEDRLVLLMEIMYIKGGLPLTISACNALYCFK